MINVVYFSNFTRNTERFVRKLGVPVQQIPVKGSAELVSRPYVLITPTYGDSTPNSFVPRQVSRFLQTPEHESLLRGVIATGNRNFNEEYAIAGDILSQRYNVPLLTTFEMSGTKREVALVLDRLENYDFA